MNFTELGITTIENGGESEKKNSKLKKNK